jgi:hypothetical protein
MSALGHKRTTSLFDYFVGYLLNLSRNREVKRLCGLEIDYEFEFGWLLYGKIGRFCTFEYPVNVRCRTTEQIIDVRAIRHERTRFGEAPQIVHGWQASRSGKLQENITMGEEDWIINHIKRLTFVRSISEKA